MKFSTFTIARADTGAILPFCVVTVYLADGVTKATLYNAGGSGIGNPLTADVNGSIGFAAINGTYILKAVSADGTYTVPNISVDVFDMTAVVAALAAAKSATNAKEFGAVGDGVTIGENVAINNALATGKSVYLNEGTFLLSDAVTCTTPGQVIRGAGRNLTILKVPATFNLSALGVLVSNTGEPGFDVRDLQIQFVQPDTSIRANLINYPPAIYANAAARYRLRDCKIVGAKTGVDMRGNTGGAIIDNLEMSSFDYGIRIDNSLDSVRVTGLHHWPFGLTANQKSIFYDSSCVGIETGRCDDFHLSDGLFLGGGLQMWARSTSFGTTFGNVENCDFDTYGSIQIDGGNISVAECFFTIGNAAKQAIVHTAGYVRVVNSEFECNVALTNPMVSIAGAGGNPFAQFADCLFRTTGDMNVLSFTSSAGLTTGIVSGIQFVLPQSSSPANAAVTVGSGVRMTFTGNRTNDKGTGTGTLLSIAADDYHVVRDNAFLGWGLTVPASWSNIEFGGNTGIAQGDFINNRLVGKLQYARFTGTAVAGGTVSIAHGIGAANYKTVDVRVGYKGGSGEWTAASATVDGTNINVTGAGASAKVRAFLTYTETQDVW